jgi:hypothetical protein
MEESSEKIALTKEQQDILNEKKVSDVRSKNLNSLKGIRDHGIYAL